MHRQREAVAEDVGMMSALVPEGLRDAVVKLARLHDRSISGEIREALRRHVSANQHPNEEERR